MSSSAFNFLFFPPWCQNLEVFESQRIWAKWEEHLMKTSSVDQSKHSYLCFANVWCLVYNYCLTEPSEDEIACDTWSSSNVIYLLLTPSPVYNTTVVLNCYTWLICQSGCYYSNILRDSTRELCSYLKNCIRQVVGQVDEPIIDGNQYSTIWENAQRMVY